MLDQGTTNQILKKWGPLLDHPDMPPIRDHQRRVVTSFVIENTQKALLEENQSHRRIMLQEAGIPVNFMGASSSDPSGGGLDTFDPVLISLIRRSMPNLIAYDICGVQPLTGPTGLIFAQRSRYANQTHTEAFYNEAATDFSTVVSSANTLGLKHTGSYPGPGANLAANGVYNFAGGMSTAQGEALGTDSNSSFAEMAFTLEQVVVTAKTRGLAASYTHEAAQDMRAIHGLDTESELANILTGEILADINREVVRTINITAKPGAQENTTTAGVFDLDTDSNGRWSVERFKGLMFFLDRECNAISKATRRGKGNIMICSSDVASALRAAGLLDYNPTLQAMSQMNIDDTGNTFAGVVNGAIRVYIDPYVSGGHYCTLGYRGRTPYDAGLFYCPYVPLQLMRSVDPTSFHPRIGFKTRYGIVANPFAEGTTAGAGALTKDSNNYYRRVVITNLM